MKAREYFILDECVERGVELGWARAHKHNDNPSPQDIKDAVWQAVLMTIHEYFVFDMDADDFK